MGRRRRRHRVVYSHVFDGLGGHQQYLEYKRQKMSQDAVVEHLASICVAQFEGTDNKAEKLNTLVETDSWKRSKYVTDQGWATMPGSESAARDVATECAQRLAKMKG